MSNKFLDEICQKINLDDDVKEYIKNDIFVTTRQHDEWLKRNYYIRRERSEFAIKKVIFNGPATIVLWKDGTKTIVKTQNAEVFDPEKGLAMAITKKALGNKGNYYNIIRPHIDEYKREDILELHFDADVNFQKALNKLTKNISNNFNVTFKTRRDE